jgi:uncharacterized protein (UPF0548 family)
MTSVPSGLGALIHIGRPTPQLLQRLLELAASSELSYAEVGATLRNEVPDGYRSSGTEQLLGTGDTLWTAACAALDDWAMFKMPWVMMPPNERPFVGQNVAFASQQLGFWSLHSCRVVGVVNEPERHGFAYGTLATHAMRGEELFTVERRQDTVYFCIRKFALASHPLLRMMQPVSGRIQARFDRDATTAMKAGIRART